jgi:oligopeptide transport system substrate-binding protein
VAEKPDLFEPEATTSVGTRPSRVSRRQVLKATGGAAGGAALASSRLGGAGAAPGTSAAHAVRQQAGEEQIFYSQVISTGDPKSFDWNADLYCGGDPEMAAGLMAFDADNNVVPDWAERFEVNEDASKYTFYIRKDNKGWTDSTPVTAQDFVFSWPRLLDPKTANPYGNFLIDIKYGEAYQTNTPINDPNDPLNGKVPTPADLGLKAIDDWTLEVTLAGPRANFLQRVAYTASVPAPKWQIDKYGDKWASGETPIVGNGPFKVDEWVHDQKVVLSPNPNYWNAETIKLTKVVDPLFPAANNMLLYEKGSGDQQLDWTQVNAGDYKRYSADPVLAKQLQPYVFPGIWFLLPQVTLAPFDKLEVRQALSHAVDRDRLVTVTNGLETPAFCMVPPGVYGFLDDASLPTIQDFDPQKAMAALKGTEFEGGKNWPEITMYMRNNEELFNADIMANDIVDQLKQNLGMDVKIQLIQNDLYRQQMGDYKWQLLFVRWWYDYPDPDNGYGDMFYSADNTIPARRQAWWNKDFDDLVNAGKAEPDPEKRLAIYLQAETVLQKDVGYIPLVFRLDQYVFKPWVKGVPVTQQGYVVPDGNIFVRMLETVFIEGREER